MKNSTRKKYTIAIIIFIALLVFVIIFGKGGYGRELVNKLAEVVDMNVVVAIFSIIVLSILIFKMYSSFNDWEKLVYETKRELVSTTCELADTLEELEDLKKKFDKIKENHPEIDFEAEIVQE